MYRVYYRRFFIKATDVNSWVDGLFQTQEIYSEKINYDTDKKIYFADIEKLSLQNKLTKSDTFGKKCIMWRGEEIGKSSELVLDYKSANCLPLITGKEARRYSIPIASKWIRSCDVEKSLENYKHSKILIRQVGECINATIDDSLGVTTQSVYSLFPKDVLEQKHLRALLGILNSKLFDFFYRLVSGDKQMFKRIILENIKV